jgi:hypothetical protein
MTRARRPPLKQAEAISGLLKQVLGNAGYNEHLPRYQVWLAWDRVVGEQIAHRARPLRIRDKTLEVLVDHPVWMQQLQMLKPQILQKIRTQLPDCDIEDIYLRHGKALPVAAPPAPSAPDWQAQTLSAEEKQDIERSIAAIHDPELKESMRRLFTYQKQLNKAKGELSD